jgi:hypothetical protein
MLHTGALLPAACFENDDYLLRIYIILDFIANVFNFLTVIFENLITMSRIFAPGYCLPAVAVAMGKELLHINVIYNCDIYMGGMIFPKLSEIC